MYRCNRSEITLDLTSGLPLRPTVDFVVEKMCLLGEPYSAISWRCNFSSCYGWVFLKMMDSDAVDLLGLFQ